MKNFKFLLIACFAFLLASCGGKKGNSDEAIKLTPETTHIKGELGDYFEVVDKEYTVTTDNWGDLVSIEVKRTDEDYVFDINGVKPYGISGRGVNGHAGFGIEILDENGNVIEKSAATTGGIGGMYSTDDMKEALKLRADETGTVRWLFHFDTNKKPAKFRLTSAYEIDITSDFEDVEETIENMQSSVQSSVDEYIENMQSSVDDYVSGITSNDNNSDDDIDSYSSAASSGSQDWDALLDSYEQYVDECISYMKKASKGDINALTEYPALMEKANEFNKKLEGAKGSMSSSQLNRYIKICKKMSKAAADM
jgi:hypothetical protein